MTRQALVEGITHHVHAVLHPPVPQTQETAWTQTIECLEGHLLSNEVLPLLEHLINYMTFP